MANLKEIRTRITSVKSTKQITSAMKMVSAAKLRKAQDTALKLRPYSIKLKQIFAQLTLSAEDLELPLAEQREVKKVLFVLITSNKGLCGAFNANVIKKSFQSIVDKYQEHNANDNIEFYAIGKKGSDLLKSKGVEVTYKNDDLVDSPGFSDISDFADRLMKEFESKEFDRIVLFYNQFKNAAVQILMEEQLLPIQAEEEDDDNGVNLDYILEPDKETIITELMPKTVRTQLYKAILDSVASEHGARMTAMHKATDNATELIKSLQLEYNKARQASITNEILEIVGGAEALKG